MEKKGALNNSMIQKEDIFLQHLNLNKNPLKNEEFIKGSLETFDKYFNEEKSIKTSKKPLNQLLEYSPISKKNDFNKYEERIINGGQDKNSPFDPNIKDNPNEKNVEMNPMKKQLFNTLQSFEPEEDLKKKKLFLNRESAKRSRLKKKKYVENLEKEYLFLKEEIMKFKSLPKPYCKNNMEKITKSTPNNNIIKNIIMDNKAIQNIDINFNININNPKDKEITNLKKEELNIISNNLEKESKTVNNYINKQKKLLQNLLIKQIDIITPTSIKNFQKKFLKLEEIKKDDNISIIKNKINKNLEAIIELYDIDITNNNNEINLYKNKSKGNNIYNFYKDLKSYIEQYGFIYNKIDNLAEEKNQ